MCRFCGSLRVDESAAQLNSMLGRKKLVYLRIVDGFRGPLSIRWILKPALTGNLNWFTFGHARCSGPQEGAQTHRKDARISTRPNGRPSTRLKGVRPISAQLAQLWNTWAGPVSLPPILQMGGLLVSRKGYHSNRGVLCWQS